MTVLTSSDGTLKTLVIVLVGPTASGKTDLALQIAQNLKLSVINVDSRQVYLGMDIGTAKPTKLQTRKVPHHLIDLRHPDNPINAQEFQKIAKPLVEKTLHAKGMALLSGGSGLYMKTLISGLQPPPVNPQPIIRESFHRLGQAWCYSVLKVADPAAAMRIGPFDAVRTQRALEVIYATGQPFSCQKNAIPPKWNILELGLDPKDLSKRIIKRTEYIYSNGLIEETKKLSEKFSNKLPMLQTIGYREALQVINNQLTKKQAIELTTLRTNQLAKRQRTWFKGQHSPHWLNDEEPLSEALRLIKVGLG